MRPKSRLGDGFDPGNYGQSSHLPAYKGTWTADHCWESGRLNNGFWSFRKYSHKSHNSRAGLLQRGVHFKRLFVNIVACKTTNAVTNEHLLKAKSLCTCVSDWWATWRKRRGFGFPILNRFVPNYVLRATTRALTYISSQHKLAPSFLSGKQPWTDAPSEATADIKKEMYFSDLWDDNLNREWH